MFNITKDYVEKLKQAEAQLMGESIKNMWNESK